jgi:hypothetical protein
VSVTIGQARLERWVGRPAFWWTAMALLLGGPLLSGLLRTPPPPLPVLDQVPATGRGRLVVFADPGCPECLAAASERLHGLSRHLRSVRPGFDLEWISVGTGATTAPSGVLDPATQVSDPSLVAPLIALLGRRSERALLLRAERAVLVDARGRIRAFPDLGESPGRELLPAITQVVNGR